MSKAIEDRAQGSFEYSLPGHSHSIGFVEAQKGVLTHFIVYCHNLTPLGEQNRNVYCVTFKRDLQASSGVPSASQYMQCMQVDYGVDFAIHACLTVLLLCHGSISGYVNYSVTIFLGV